MGEAESEKPRRKRSRTGCLSCRRRKKKCDELSYPVCRNCADRGIVCEWPLKKHQLYQKLQEVRYVDDFKVLQGTSTQRTGVKDGSEHQNQFTGILDSAVQSEPLPILKSSISRGVESPLDTEQVFELPDLDTSLSAGPVSYPPDTQKIRRVSHESDHNRQRRHSKSNRYILNRIALQQDCVDADEGQLPRNTSITSSSFNSLHSYNPNISIESDHDTINPQIMFASDPIAPAFSTSSIPSSQAVQEDLNVNSVFNPKNSFIPEDTTK